MKQIATSTIIPSFRSGGCLEQSITSEADQSRRSAGLSRVLTSEAHRQWRNRAWKHRNVSIL